MRFGRRNKTGTMWGRLASSEDSVAEHNEEIEPYQHEGDPAQALLNVLGRFQRHYLRGKEGVDQSAWSDDCMNALIDAVDVAVAQRWQEVVSVLTETARVLQTYEDADRANECVPFLTSSHEVMCHMVGDLLSGQIRPGLLRKWESLNERTHAEVEAAGLLLVQDEVSDQELAYEAFSVDAQKNSPFDEPSPDIETEMDTPEAIAESQAAHMESETTADEPEPMLPFELPELSDEVSSELDDVPTLDDLPDLSDSGDVTPTVEDAAESEIDEEPPAAEDDVDPRILSFPSPPASDELEMETASATEEDIPSLPVDEPSEAIEAPVESVESEQEIETEIETTEPDPSEDISGILDAACEALSNVTDNLDAFELQVRELEARANESEWSGASASCRSVLRLLEMLDTRNIEPTDRFLELAYGFSGVYVESRDSVSTDEYRAFQKDCVTLLQEWMDDGDEEAESPEAAAESDSTPTLAPEEPTLTPTAGTDDPALNDLLDTVRAAMQGGRAANAKLLMLQAAARIAQEQEGEASDFVGEAERSLSENTRALEDARNAVQDHENRVTETATKVSEVQHGQEAHRRQTTQLAELLEESQGRVDSLDEQIRELENRRAAAEADRAFAQEELDAARVTEQEHEVQLEAVRGEERDARLQLEEERGRAKALQNSRGDLERAVIAKREQLARQRQSTHDIEQTIEHTRDSEAGEPAADNDSLF